MLKLKIENLNIKSILTSGACFRYTLESDGSITNILKDRVVNIKQDNKILTIKSSNYDNLENIMKEYFDLNRDYNKINKELINIAIKKDDLLWFNKDYKFKKISIFYSFNVNCIS